MTQIQINANSQQAQADAAVEELKNNLAVAQKNLDRNLQKVKKEAIQEMEKSEEKSEEASLKEIDSEIKSA